MNTICRLDAKLFVCATALISTNKQAFAVFGRHAGSRREVMNIQTPNPSAYGPVKADPIRLASATIQAVDRIGAATSEEIEKTADEIMRGATEIAKKLRTLATAIREHSRIANEHVSGFCNKATSVLEGVRDLQLKLEVNESPAKDEDAAQDTSPLPSLIRKGPADFDDTAL
jgi:hypothetical protein